MPSIKILYVEDELFLGKIVKESLEARSFEVHMESDGEKVLAAFRKIQPQVCVLDVMLPHKDGFTIAKEIREIDKNVPILFLTAKTQTDDVVKGFTLGGNDYIRKPFSMEELILRIENLLALKGNISVSNSSNSDELKMGIFNFHVHRQTLIGGAEERKLSFRESELLRFLFDHRNGIVDRRDILNQLWGNDSFFNSRNLDVYVTRLRSYLKEDSSLEIITIKGIGYRFVM